MKILITHIKNHIPILSLILSIVVAWMIFPITTGFPLVALAIFFIGLSSLSYLLKKDKTWTDSVLYFGVLSLSFFTVYRSNEFLQFFDFLSIIFLISLLVRPVINVPSIFHLLLSPVTIFFNTLISKNVFKYTFTLPMTMKRKNYLKEYPSTILLTAAVMLITIPLLASANPLFNNVLHQTLAVLNLEWVWRFFITDSIVIYIFRTVALVFLAFMTPQAFLSKPVQ